MSARRSWLGLLLKLAGVGVVGWAQVVVETRRMPYAAAFALGAVLFLVGERIAGLLPAREERTLTTGAAPRLFWGLLVAGCGLCFAAGLLVHRRAAVTVTHTVWAAGLAGLIVAAGLAWWREPRSPRPPAQLVGTRLALFLVTIVLYGWHLTTIPAEVHGDEAEVGNDAVQLIEHGPPNLFTVGWYWLPMLHAVPAALGLKLFGVNLLGLRSPSAAMGVASVLLLFAIVHQWWGFEVALLSGLLLASARFFIHLSRTGYHYIGTPFVSVLVVWLFSRAWRERRLSAAVWCGVAVGLGIQGYYASRLVPVLLTATWLFWLAGSASPRGRIAGFVVLVAAATAAAAPMIGYFWDHWADLWLRTRGTSVFVPAAIEHLSQTYGTHDLTTIFLIQLRSAFTLFNFTGDTSLQYGCAGSLLEPVTAVLFVLGVAATCARPLQPRSCLLLLWTGVPVLVGAALTIDTPFFPRISGIVPFAAVIAAVAVHSVLANVRALLPRRVGRAVTAVVLAGVVAVVFANNVRSYFIEYAPHYRHGPAVDIAAWIRANGSGKVTYMVGGAPGFYIKHGTIRFLTHGYDTRDIVDLDETLRTQRIDAASSRFIIMPAGHDLLPTLMAGVGALDVREHRNLHGDVDFYTAIPLAASAPGAGRARDPHL